MTAFTLNNRSAPLAGGQADEGERLLEGAFRASAADAEDYIDGTIAPLRATATKMYRGEPLGNEEVGRSQIVTTDVRDATLAILPSLMRIFVSGENVVEFVPTSGRTIDLADQQTAYVNYVFMQDNPGFLNLYSCFKDALVRKTGVIKWRWSKDETVTESRFTGIPAEQVVVLKQDKTVEKLDISEADPIKTQAVDPATGQPVEQDIPAFDVVMRRRFEKKRMIIECLPPEEYIFNRDARDTNSEYGWNFQGHRSFKTVSELVAMGYDKNEILLHAQGGDTFQMNYEAQTRNPAVASFATVDTPDDSMRPVLFIEGYMRVDKDGDGIAELRCIHAIGDAYHVLDDWIVDEAPFATFCPDPEPHMVIGGSVADQTMDMQWINSNIMRNVLDSLAGSIHPRTVIVEGQVNPDDALNTEQGAVIRARNINAVNELVKPFIGQQALPIIAWLDQVKSKRTGITDASQGLDPSMLQSATHAAVSATVSGAQERIELYARIFAETGMKRLFRGVAKCLRENQDQERVVKLNGSWVAVDPRNWEGELEVVPNVVIGKGSDQEKIAFLGMVLQKQELIIQTLGPTNPLAGIDKYRATLAQVMTLAGFKDANRYFGQITPEYMRQLQEKASQPPPDPRMLLVQVEKEKSDQQFQLAQIEEKRKQDEIQANLALKEQEAQRSALQKELDSQAQREIELERIASAERIAAGQQATQLLVAQEQASAQTLIAANQLAEETFHKNEDRKVELAIAHDKQLHEREMAEKALQQKAADNAAARQAKTEKPAK